MATHQISRRESIKKCLAVSTALSITPILYGKNANTTSGNENRGAAQRIVPLNQDWLFSSEQDSSALQPEFDDRGFSRITLPHCVVPLSWQKWNPQTWEKVCTYRRHFSFPREFTGHRIFV